MVFRKFRGKMVQYLKYSAVLLILSLCIVNSQFFSTRIVGGIPSTIDQYPILAQLLLDTWGSQEFLQHCAGVILTSRHIISTAHCFQYNADTGRNYTLTKYWKVRVGSSYRSRGGVLHNLKTIIPHPDFDKYYYTNDIAVLVVTKKFVFNEHVGQGTIAKYKSEIRPNVLCSLVGWGSMESTGPQSEQLQQTALYIIDSNECKVRYSSLGAAILDSMMCAGKMDIGGADGCFGDSGGPLLYKGVVVGLVSFGYDCGHYYYPGVYTKISHFTEWIVKTISRNK